ncbi:uncharacterized protein LOC110688593 [Chenopodium quinoa]|uniref:uncharacterized protein LOC110688593 n=1 Tax=Chenopodium quinoa TaxID=63459 RepID=UPI000B7846B7|nr:uncharacterized protein LOC110688593 [Chenopodium quinoa]
MKDYTCLIPSQKNNQDHENTMDRTTLYKLVSKSIVMRLKNILPVIVSENQSAFVPGRLITDNALIALELFHTMKKRSTGRKRFMAMKLDMSKAYDRVEWGFLRRLLLTMGFDGRWVNLVVECVSSVTYSFVINGDVCGASNVQERKLHGEKASRNGPNISHLLFAYDSLLFTRATRQECQTVVEILNQYELASGQKINYDKSEVSFSKGVTADRRGELMSIPSMRQVDRHEKYLGIPTIVSRSRKAVFEALTDRIWKRLQGWKEKLLSRAGEEILLKSVIHAIPTYLMGVYKLPATVVQRIQSAMARFWWGTSEGKRKTHWRNWSSMCTLKCLGGSYSWRSIWSSKALVKEGILWKVGNGRNIHLWKDPWVADAEGRFLTSTTVPELLRVSDIIDGEKREWCLDVINNNFNERDRQIILAIPISEADQEDELCWAFSMTGHYTVKSTYMLGKGGDFDTFHQAWVEIWKAEVSPKVKHFFWRLCSGTLPTRSLLLHRHMIEDDSCPWCGDATETVEHALVGCSRVRDLWTECNCEQMTDWSTAASVCDLVVSWKALGSKVKQRGMFLAWCIWGERNRKIFENKTTPNEILSQRVHRYVDEFDKYNARIYKAVNPLYNRSSNKLEAKGLLRALNLAAGHSDIILESDCKMVIDRLSKGARYSTELYTISQIAEGSEAASKRLLF